MVLELRVWGPAFGLPSIDPECIATVAYFNRIVPPAQWVLIANHDPSISPRREFPVLLDGAVRTTGFADIVSYLRNHRSGACDLDYHLPDERQTDKTAFLSFLQSTAGPLVDLSLYVASENYYSTTSSAYTAILPWYLNYTIPPARRDLARSRTAHLGLGSLDIQIADDDGSKPGGRGLGSEFDAAKKEAGIPTQSNELSMGRKAGLQGLLSSPIYAARFKLDALSNELLEPLAGLLGKKDYLLDGGKPSSLDCAAFGYLALMFYPPVPQAWLKDALQARFPRLVSYIGRMREELLGGEDVKAADVWPISSHNGDDAEVQNTLHRLGLRLPWRPQPTQAGYLPIVATTWEFASKLPLLSNIFRPRASIQADVPNPPRKALSSLPSQLSLNLFFTFSATVTALLAGMAIHHRRSPREGALIFWALRPQPGGLGEAGKILSVLGNQLVMPQAM